MVSTEIKYEVVQEGCIEDIVELYTAAGWWDESPKAREAVPMMIKGSFCFMTASYQGSLVGMGRVISDGVSDGYIQDVVVKKEYRRLGIGTELVKRLGLFCLEHGLEWVGLIAEPHTVKFYEQIGFREMRGFKPMLLDKEQLI